jgi:outer membrane lipoprotein-sorting protein
MKNSNKHGRAGILTIVDKIMAKCRWVGGFLSLWVIIGCALADSKTEDVIKDIESKVSTITSYRYDMVIKISGVLEDTVTCTGKISYKKPDMIHMEIKIDKPMAIGIDHDGPLTIIRGSDGEIFYQYMPEKKVVQKMSINKKGNIPHSSSDQLFRDITKVSEELVKSGIQYAGEGELDGKKMYILQKEEPTITPGTEIPDNYSKTKLWIGQKDGLLRKMETFSKSGEMEMRMSHEYKNIELNPVFAEDTFHFSPPDDAQVIDESDAIR